jgi:hypothetical protein
VLQLQLAAKQHLAVVHHVAAAAAHQAVNHHVVAAAVQHVAPALDVQVGLVEQLHQLPLQQQQLQLPLMHLHLQLKQLQQLRQHQLQTLHQPSNSDQLWFVESSFSDRQPPAHARFWKLASLDLREISEMGLKGPF